MDYITDRDLGDENDFILGDDDFYLDDDFDDDFDDDGESFGSLVPNKPYPKGPAHGDTMELERELFLCC